MPIMFQLPESKATGPTAVRVARIDYVGLCESDLGPNTTLAIGFFSGDAAEHTFDDAETARSYYNDLLDAIRKSS